MCFCVKNFIGEVEGHLGVKIELQAVVTETGATRVSTFHFYASPLGRGTSRSSPESGSARTLKARCHRHHVWVRTEADWLDLCLRLKTAGPVGLAHWGLLQAKACPSALFCLSTAAFRAETKLCRPSENVRPGDNKIRNPPILDHRTGRACRPQNRA